ncbi:MAG: hypothetical protein WDZ84_07960 [Rhodovibrionaceae bacterium]
MTKKKLEDYSDNGRRRLLSWSPDFDTTSNILNIKIDDGWEEEVKQQWINNKRKIIEGIKLRYGVVNFEQKISNFVDIDSKPFSILSHHNHFHAQAREAFVMGSYFPALTASCALGERILNHLIIDLRDFFKKTSEYKKVYRKESFDDWNIAIDILSKWNIILPCVGERFMLLKE